MNENKSKHTFLANLMIVTYLLLNLIHYIVDLIPPFHHILLLIINGIALFFFSYFLILKKSKPLLLYTSLMFLGGVLSFVFAKNIEFIEFFLLLRYLGMSMVLIHTELDKKLMNVMMIITLLFFFPVFTKIAGYNIFAKASQNYHSILLMTHNFVFNLAYWKKKERASNIPTILCFFISFFSGGRGPIIAYALFLLGTVITNLRISLKRDVHRITIQRTIEVILTLLLILLSIYKYNLYTEEMKYLEEHGPDEFTEELSQQRSGDDQLFFSTQGVKSSARSNIIKHYFQEAIKKPQRFLFGVAVTSVEYFGKFKYNLHNSYLKLHAKFGLLGAILSAYLVIRTIIQLLKHRNFGLLILLLGVLFRILTDSAAFPGHLDIILFAFAFGLSENLLVEEH